ncbi:hypothetical protein N7468_004575 [Penicillium chermesinum]|uniref:Uncharacterized protein n=1 Tax=Penicillium chermesinum TaxID=63820 RepID=A0A9W9P8K0_9EURO|nr:uncharacterized protein N7468_004575 [Penicillium chermesinum]KAJ5239956.1 hypothetical protein N7468_004575 [Penicillium chermesinum]KAJ6166830.1 hypothetical protein N7470_002277 [Penicillium chermesinum]
MGAEDYSLGVDGSNQTENNAKTLGKVDPLGTIFWDPASVLQLPRPFNEQRLFSPMDASGSVESLTQNVLT